MKLSKGAKSRLDLMSAAERKKICSSTRMLAEAEVISMQRAKAVIKWCNRSRSGF
mgnify:CR=1 FL=1